jgi:recombination protein RecA
MDSDESFLNELKKGTEFQFISKDGIKGFTDRPAVSTPIEVLNCFLGGGIPLGAIAEFYGPNASGKSSVAYEIMGRFQKEYPGGVAVILDSETSVDPMRLTELGVNINQVLILGAKTLEDGFDQIAALLKKKSVNKKLKDIPVLIVWDTISTSPTRAQAAGGQYAGGMAEAARVIKAGLKNIFTQVAEQNMLLIILNQVVASIGGYRPSLTTGGGNALNVA